MTALAVPSLNPEAIALLNAMASGIALKDAGTTAGAQLHGPGGLLATPGMNKQIINAMIMPRGLAGKIPVRKSISTNEIYGIMTGLTETSGSEPTEACAAWPTVGQFKVCRQTFPFGQQGRQSQVLNVKHVGEIVNRGEFTDNVLLGAPVMDSNATPGPVNWNQVLQKESEKKIGELFTGYFRDYARFTYTGNPQTTAGSQGWVQYRGLDLQIADGKRDAITCVLCPAANSIVMDLNGTNVTTSGATVYDLVANVITNLERLSEYLGLDVTWAIAGRYGAFWAITNVWPCVYATTGCAVNTIIRTSSAEEMTNFRDRMRRERKLYIEGKSYDFIVDDTITEETAAGGVVGTYESDLYFVPLTANGEPMLFWEYFDMLAEAVQAANKLAPGGYFDTLQNGRFLFVKQSPTHTCVQVEIIERPRLILAAPFLAAKFTNMRYNITVKERDWDPASEYFADGGGVNTPIPYFYPNSQGG